MTTTRGASSGGVTRAEQADATKEALVAAGRELFGRDGYAATSLGTIVDAAGGVTKGAFYHHFDSKQQLFLAVLEQVQHEIGRRAFVVHLDEEGHAPGDDDGEPEVRDLSAETDEEVWAHLLRGCRAYLEMLTLPEVQRIVLIDGRSVLPWTTWHEIQSRHGVVLLRADLRRARGRGIVRDLPLRALSTMLAGALNEACIAIANAEDREAALEEAMEVVGCFLDGLRAG